MKKIKTVRKDFLDTVSALADWFFLAVAVGLAALLVFFGVMAYQIGTLAEFHNYIKVVFICAAILSVAFGADELWLHRSYAVPDRNMALETPSKKQSARSSGAGLEE